jgi:hypothetical protein
MVIVFVQQFKIALCFIRVIYHKKGRDLLQVDFCITTEPKNKQSKNNIQK